MSVGTCICTCIGGQLAINEPDRISSLRCGVGVAVGSDWAGSRCSQRRRRSDGDPELTFAHPRKAARRARPNGAHRQSLMHSIELCNDA